MKKIIKNTFLISIIFTFFICCNNQKTKLEATVYLKDMNGNPIADRWTYSVGYLKVKDSMKTDKDGRTSINTIWYQYFDDENTFWSLAPKKDNKYIPVNFVFPPNVEEKEISITDTMKMDTLKDIKIRLKSLRNDLIKYNIAIGRSGYIPSKLVYGGIKPTTFSDEFFPAPTVHNSIKVNYGIVFGKYKSANLPSQDTVINVKAYSKAAFSIVIRPYYVGNLLLPDKELIVKENQDRNGTILFEY